MFTPRGVVIDDTDLSRIHYSGQGWFEDRGSQDNAGTWGPTYNRTSHGTNGNDTLSFKFEGTSITVFGTTHLARIDNDTRWDPSWECFVDGISIGANGPVPDPQNNKVLCYKDVLNDGQHEITVNITSTGNKFWLDYLVFTPSPKASFDEVVLKVDNGDPGIFLDSNWKPLTEIANMTSVKGSQAKFDFVGTSVTWVGRFPTEFSHAPASGSFAIDGGPSTSFKLNGLPLTTNTTVYNQRFFTTPDLSPGPHSLLVTYNAADGDATPLTLDYLYVTNTSTTHVSSHNNASGGSSKTPVGAIVGGVVAGLAFIGCIFFWWRRRRRHAFLVHSELRPPLNNTRSAPYEVVPFMSGYQAPQPQSYTTYSKSPPLSLRAPEMSSSQSHTDSQISSPQVLPNSPSPNGVRTVTQMRPMHKGQVAVPRPTVTSAHQDSGLRFPQQDVEDIPPSYTAA